MRQATKSDLPAIRNALSARPEQTMFPLSNLARFGFEGPHDYAPFFWMGEGAAMGDVLTIGRAGMVMPFLPSGDLSGALSTLLGRKITGFIGPAPQTRPLFDALPCRDAPTMLNRDEPHYALDLSHLKEPEGSGTLVPLGEVDRDILLEWRAAYQIEALGEEPGKAHDRAETEIAGYIEADSHRALLIDRQPVAMSGFNAALPDIVQIGGVFTPKALRNKGYARQAVALHLAQARARGVRRATLFASGAAACRAYEALGFSRIGEWSLILFKDPQDV